MRVLHLAQLAFRAVPLFFFFSSRRRHTRCGRDWSSDVCSSDLNITQKLKSAFSIIGVFIGVMFLIAVVSVEIGRASCRERVEISVVAVSLKKKKKEYM